MRFPSSFGIRRWRWLIVILIIAGLILLWRWRQPRELEVTGRYRLAAVGPDSDVGMAAGRDGYSCWTNTRGDLRVYYFTWQGQLRWCIRAPRPTNGGHMPPMAGGVNEDYFMRCGSSPDGRYCAVYIPGKKRAALHFWKDGKPCGKAALPIVGQPQQFPQVQVLDSGQAFCWDYSHPFTPFYRADSEGRVARGQAVLPMGMGASSNMWGGMVTLDGRAYIAHDGMDFHVYRMTDKQGTLALTQLFTGAGNLPCAVGSRWIGNDGTVYDARGKILARTKWYAAGPNIAMYPRTAIAQWVEAPNSYESLFRVYKPGTGKTWAVSPGQVHGLCLTSPDGRYAFINEQSDWQRTAEKVDRKLGTFFAQHRSTDPTDVYYDYLCIYERPGRLRARLHVGVWTDFRVGWGTRMSLEPDLNGYLGSMLLSPDGHTVVAAAEVWEGDGKQSHFEVVRLGW